MDRLRAAIELPPSARDFASGLLVDIVGALRRSAPGELVAFTAEREVGEDVERWSRFTGNALIATTREANGWRYVVRNGAALHRPDDERPVGSRLWLYTNFDCNLACDYCCARSSPTAPRRELGLERVRAIARASKELGVADLFVTGGEPFLLDDIGEILAACAEAARTTVLTNAMLFAGRRRAALASQSRDRVVLQVSLDSPDPGLHDAHRGAGSWAKTMRGIAIARELGFRVRLAATVSVEAEQHALEAYFDREGVAHEDRVIRRVALRGFASQGVALARADLQPEPTITSRGVYWHPVGADDDDFFVTGEALPLSRAIESVRLAWEEERRFAQTLASVFHCA